MGILRYFSGSSAFKLVRLPTGCFTVDSSERIIVSTLPQTFPPALAREIGHLVIATFQGAREAQLPLTELTAHYAALKLTARELKGGAIIFFSPRSLNST